MLIFCKGLSTEGIISRTAEKFFSAVRSISYIAFKNYNLEATIKVVSAKRVE